MKIEVGKFYSTENGKKVRIYALDAGSGNRIHGAILEEGEWYVEYWNFDGTKDGISNRNITNEWVEPPPKKSRLIALLHITTGNVKFQYPIDAKDLGWMRLPWLDEPEHE